MTLSSERKCQFGSGLTLQEGLHPVAGQHDTEASGTASPTRPEALLSTVSSQSRASGGT